MKGYRRKLFWGACALETVSLLFFLCACAAIAFAVTVENISASYELRLQSIDKQAVSRLEASEEFIRIAAEQSSVTEACRSFFSPSSALQQSEAFLDLRAALVQLSHNHPQFQFSFFFTRSSALTLQGVFAYSPGAAPRSLSAVVLAASAMDVMALNSGSAKSYLGPHNILYSMVNDDVLLVAVLPDELIFAAKGDMPFYVEDESGRLLYESGARPAKSRQIEYTNSQNGLHYVYLLDVHALMKDILHQLLAPFMFAVALGLIALCGIALLTGWVMSPFQRLAEAMRSYPALGPRFPAVLRQLRSMRSFQLRVFLLYLVCLIPMLLPLPALTHKMENCVISAMADVHSDTVELSAGRIVENLDVNRQFINIMAYSDELAAFLSPKTDAASNCTFSELLLKNRAFQMGITDAAIYDKAGKLLERTSTAQPDFLSASILGHFQRKYAFFCLYPDRFDTDNISVIVAIRNIHASASERYFSTLGFLSFQIIDVFADELGESNMGTFFLYDKTQWRLVATPAYLQERALIEGMCQSGLIRVDSRDMRTVTLPAAQNDAGSDPRRMIFATPIEGTSYTLVCSLPIAPLRAFARQLPAYIGMFVCAFILAALTIDLLFSRRITRLSRLTEKYFGSATPDCHELPVSLQSENEISALALAFHESMERISQLNHSLLRQRERQAVLENRRRQAEVIALQSQMDSHLISNIFAAMKLLLVQREYGPLTSMIDATGAFLRTGLVHNEYDVTLQREIDHVNAYAAIQTLRFGERLQVELTPIAPHLLNAMVPKYLLQPLIENAIHHGMRPRQTLHVVIRISQEDTRLRVEVENDGAGMTLQAVDVLNQRLRQSVSSEHIGLINVAERVRLRFGDEYGLHIKSAPDEKTVVTILMPIVLNTSERKAE